MKDLYPSRGLEEKIIKRVDDVVYSKEKIGKYSLEERELEAYEQDGFIILPEVFSSKEIKKLKEELKELEANEKLRKKEEFISEPDSNKIRTIFNQHLFSKIYKKLSRDPRILNKVMQILGSDVYIHHGRINVKRAYRGKSFPWHSDFETWHSEDGLPNCRCLSAWVMLTDNTQFNGPLYLIKQSHKKFVSCEGITPKDNYKKSLKKQEYGVPSINAIKKLAKNDKLVSAIGKAGTLVLHDGNILHGSSDNISPDDRTNIFFVYNSVKNTPVKPFASKSPRAPFLSLQNFKPLKTKKEI
ncbi:phytanoyl-CoA dioxygenase family protein [bacterium]|jgi:ectoine hydroxylase|nr:phytanoyl-CoA dioxygenase family protein [bacterium]